MTEIENQVEETQEEESQIETQTEDETTDDYQEQDNQDSDAITYEQALEWKKKAERLDKAEKKLVELKKEKKQQVIQKTEDQNPEDLVNKILEEREFFRENPEANSYKDKIKEYQAKGLGLEDAYLLASKEDRQIEQNRGIYGTGIVKGSTNIEGVTLVSIDRFDYMTSQEQEEYTGKFKGGKVKFKY